MNGKKIEEKKKLKSDTKSKKKIERQMRCVVAHYKRVKAKIVFTLKTKEEQKEIESDDDVKLINNNEGNFYSIIHT